MALETNVRKHRPHLTREIDVKCLPSDIPTSVEVNVVDAPGPITPTVTSTPDPAILPDLLVSDLKITLSRGSDLVFKSEIAYPDAMP